MQYLHKQFVGGPECVVTVRLSHRANVLLLDAGNYQAFRSGRGFHHYGGFAVRTPCVLRPPRNATWHVVVQPERGSSVRASIDIECG